MDFEQEANHSGLTIGKTNKLGYLICLINIGVMILSSLTLLSAESASRKAKIDFNNIEQIVGDWGKRPYTEVNV